MVWQDIVLTVANIIFGYALTYQVYKGFKEKKGFIALRTSATTALGLFGMVVAFFTLNLYFSTITAFFNGTMWLTLLIQRLIYEKV